MAKQTLPGESRESHFRHQRRFDPVDLARLGSGRWLHEGGLPVAQGCEPAVKVAQGMLGEARADASAIHKLTARIRGEQQPEGAVNSA